MIRAATTVTVTVRDARAAGPARPRRRRTSRDRQARTPTSRWQYPRSAAGARSTWRWPSSARSSSPPGSRPGACPGVGTGAVADRATPTWGASRGPRDGADTATRGGGPLPSRPWTTALALPNFPAGASPEGIEAAAEVAERLGWSTVWTTDHVLVPGADAGDYGRIYEAILTLAWVGARYPRVRLGTSVIVVPQRNAVLLAKELATLDSLSGGRVIAGVGIGWNEIEFANVGAGDRFHVRGAYLDETIRLWRHLWSGSTEPFRGRFHSFDDFAFGPLPAQANLPIVIGGRAEPALRRAGRSPTGTTRAARARPPTRSASRWWRPPHRPPGDRRPRCRPASGSGSVSRRTTSYAMRGSVEEIAAEVRAFAALGVGHLALAFGTTDPTDVVGRAERFAARSAPLV